MVRQYSQVLRRVWVYGILLAGSAALPAAPMLQAVLRPSDLAPGDDFGRLVVVSADGSTILAAAVLADCSAGSNCGAVYVFSRRFGAWRQEARLTAADAAGGDIFGGDMALNAAGDIALIGADGKACSKGLNCGAAYVFARTAEGTWKQQQKLVSAGLDKSDNFGAGVALSRDGATALIGAFGEQCNAEVALCGAVYEFVRNGDSWSQAGRISSPQELSANGFGGSVALSGDGQTLLVEETRFGVVGGVVHVFRRSGGGWVHEASIDAPDSCDFLFGAGMDLSDDGNTALIPVPTPCPPSLPRVFVYTREGSTWSQQAQLIPAQGSLSGGVALSGNGNEALLGLQEFLCNTLNSRVAVIFTRNGQTWSEEGDLHAANQDPAAFSASVGLSSAGAVAAVGSYVDCKEAGPPFTGLQPDPDATAVLVFGSDALAEVPALSGLGLAALALALAAAGAARLRRPALARGRPNRHEQG